MISIIPEKCNGCGRCVAVCSVKAISLNTANPDGFGQKTAVIDEMRCTHCELCFSACPYQAIAK